MREMNFSQRLRRFIVRKTFSAPYRVQFYEALRFLLENKQPLKSALEQMRDAWTDFGRKWHPFAELATDCIESLRENSGENSLEYTLGLWVPQEEAAVISAGIRSGSIVDALQFATTLTDAKKQLHQAIWQMAIYPVGLLIMMTGTLYVLNTELIPVLSKISSPDSWSGALGFLYGLSLFVDNYGAICAVLFAVVTGVISWSLKNWKSRSLADNIMPWSIYKDIQGAAFLLNMAALLKAKMTTLNSLNVLQEFASPWLSTRLDSIIYRVRQGITLGWLYDSAVIISLPGVCQLSVFITGRWCNGANRQLWPTVACTNAGACKKTSSCCAFNYADISCHVTPVTGHGRCRHSVYWRQQYG